MKSFSCYLLRLRAQALLLALLISPLPSFSQADRLQQARELFASHYASLDASRAEAPLTDDEADLLASYPLTPWLQALRLRNALSGKEPGAVLQTEAFLDAAGAAPHARDLRRALLKTLGAAEDWAGVLGQYREAAANEESRCLYAQARIALKQTNGLAVELAQRWIAADGDLHRACDGPIVWLEGQRELTGDLLTRRIRARLLDGDVRRAKQLLPMLGDEAAAPLQNWVRLLESRDTAFENLAAGPAVALDDEGLADAFLRYAKLRSQRAEELLPSISSNQQLSAASLDALTRNLAMAYALSRDARALTLYQRVPQQALDERNHEWRVRAALWAGDWQTARRWLAEMPPAMASQQRWRYWRGRAEIASGHGDVGRPMLQGLAQEFDSFGLLAAWQLGQGYVPNDHPFVVTPAIGQALRSSPALDRAHEAYLLGLNSIAALEWRAAITDMPDSARPALIREASSWGWYAQAITSATEFRVFDDAEALFPRPFSSLVEKAAERAGIDATWVYSVMRRESAFRADAASGAGALGLLQMLPSTAAITARKNGLAKPTRNDLIQPEINLPLGALHLAEMQSRFNGNWLFTLAAYNAGPNALLRWLPPQSMAADVWMENIPFNETRNYVQRILMHAAVYQWQATGKAVDPSPWLPEIEPRS